jgi:predicted DNA-binding helix-hairpin-helix protein
MRFYGFTANEIADESFPNLDLEIDPKLSWALRHPEAFPVDVNRADYGKILRVPGIGVKSAQLLIASRKGGRITSGILSKMGVVMKRAKYFITCGELVAHTIHEAGRENVRRALMEGKSSGKGRDGRQLSIIFPE